MTRPGPQSGEVMETGSRPGVSLEQSRVHSPRLLPAASPPSRPLTRVTPSSSPDRRRPQREVIVRAP